MNVGAEHDPICVLVHNGCIARPDFEAVQGRWVEVVVLGPWYCYQIFHYIAEVRTVKLEAALASLSVLSSQPDVVYAKLTGYPFSPHEHLVWYASPL
mgnify:CR=1 FL=1